MLLGDLIVGSFSESKGLALGTTGEKFHFLGFNVFFFPRSVMLCSLCEMFTTWGACLFLPLHFDLAPEMFRDNPVYIC